ncbi:MAG: MFS transporter [Actinomycetales bacterium]|nr:MFS transporter [Actinomycetales bacterium]
MTDPGPPAGATAASRIQQRTLIVLSGGAILGGVAVAGSIPAGSLLAASISGSEAVAGLAQTAGVIGAALMALPLARIALSRGRRASLAVGYATGGLGAVVVTVGAVARSLPLLLAGCLLVGVASASGYQARYAATDLAAPDSRARALSLVVWAGTIGAVLGPNLLGASGGVALGLGLPQLTGAYLLCAACLGLAAMVLLAFLRPDPYLVSRAQQPASSLASPRLSDGIGHLRGRPRAVLGITAIAIGHVVMVMVMVMTPVHMAHVDVSLSLIGLVISVHVAGMYALSPLVGWCVDRLGRVPVIGAGVIVLLAACVIAGLAPASDAVVLGIGLFLLGLGWSCTLIAGSTMVTDEVDAQERPSVQGLSDLVMNAAGAVGGIIAGIVVAVSGYGVLCAVATVPVVGLAVLAGSPRMRRPSACRVHSNTRSI